MIALIIIGLVLVALALMRFGVSAEFGEDGLFVTAHAGFLSVRILPAKPKRDKKRRKDKKAKKPKKPKKEKEKKPGKVADFKAMLPAAMKSLGRFRRRLLIKRLIVHYVSAGDDAYKTAMSFGTVNAVFSLLTPILESGFRVKRRELRTFADFTVSEPFIYVNAAISLTVWETVYIAICLIPPLLKKPQKITNGKENENHGEASDRRNDGNHNAEDTRDGGRQHNNRRAD